MPVSDESQIVVAPPLRGEWIAGNSANNRPDAAHRRAVLVDNGHAWLAQRYAIDWVQYQTVDGKRTTWKGPEDKNDSYFCYNQSIYSVAAGKVVDASDGMAENVPHSGKYAVPIDFNNAAGNHVVVEIAPHRYVLYAHMRPGTVQVKTGDEVGVGQIIGHVGNTGSSSEPHLHMHIDDQPSFLAGNGVPYEFTNGEASGAVDANVSSPTAVYFGPIGVTGGAFPRKVGGENRTVTAGRRPWWPRMAGLQPLSTRAFGPRLRRLTALTALATRPLIATKRSTVRCGQSVCKCHAEKFRSAIFARILTAVHNWVAKAVHERLSR